MDIAQRGSIGGSTVGNFVGSIAVYIMVPGQLDTCGQRGMCMEVAISVLFGTCVDIGIFIMHGLCVLSGTCVPFGMSDTSVLSVMFGTCDQCVT